ncbi:shikimate dehydrogenase family protein [Halomonas dongshanensis]|uniref:Shikimate dehydrogenase n=1 Tax=Halomonas dongshanensis TaxID=2890835 RepID=A0ABT2EAY2_9GAMM|nr:shikimate dehydrogenase [Halomonas dongshanensis]MCS2608744.1 shikimate dehydrogenase [Halomonas dongshanensis]
MSQETASNVGLPLPINGKTRLYAILGDPIAQVGSPGLFNPWFRAQGIEALLFPVHVAPSHLPCVFSGLLNVQNFDGWVVTVPHKVAVMDLIDSVTPRAQAIGAVNAVRRLADGKTEGDNFDGVGFARSLASQGIEVKGKRVLILGCGGAGRAVAFATASEQPLQVNVEDISQDSACGLTAMLTGAFPTLTVERGAGDISRFDIVVNCTTLGLKGDDPLPFDVASLNDGTLVVDIIPHSTTLLLEAAERRGLPIHRGKGMLEAQVAAIGEFFGYPALN